MGSAGGVALAKALRVNGTLKRLSLGSAIVSPLLIDSNELGGEGGKAICNALLNNESLESLSLCKISPA